MKRILVVNDPHVVALIYKLKPEPTVSFEEAAPLEDTINRFRLRLVDNILKVELLDHFSSQEKAMVEVQPFLRSWEIIFGLAQGRPSITFEFERAEIIDRNPPPMGSHQIIEAHGISSGEAFGNFTACAVHREYPKPPTNFVAAPDVETMWVRFSGYVARNEHLSSMGYMVLTVLEHGTAIKRPVQPARKPSKQRLQAAQLYRIDIEVLNKLGTLTSDVGDEKTGRKMHVSDRRAHTAPEIAWIEAAVKAITRRMGEYSCRPTSDFPQLTMAQLPSL